MATADLQPRRVRRCLAPTVGTALLALLMAAPAGHASTGSQRISANVRLGNDTAAARGRDLPGLAVDPDDPSHVVAVDEDFLGGNCDFHTSFDGGRTWTSGHLRAPEGFQQPPCQIFDSGGYAHLDQSVAFGSGQNVYTTFSSIRGVEGDSVLVARSSDGGRTFGVGVVAIQGGPVDQPVYTRPKLGVDPSDGGDRVLVEAWGSFAKDGGGLGYQVLTAASKDFGATWAPPVQASMPNEIAREITQPVAGRDGTFYLAWKRRGGAQDQIAFGVSKDHGQTWLQAVVGGPTALHKGLNQPRLAISPAGTLFVTYQSTDAGDKDVFLVRSTDGGLTWSTPLRVNDDPTANGVGQRLPQIAALPDGEVAVVWYDDRAVPVKQLGRMEDVYTAVTSGQGSRVLPNRRVTDRSINLDVGLDPRINFQSFYSPAVAALGRSKILLGWRDSREGDFDDATQDTYLATLDWVGPASAPASSLPPTDPRSFAVRASRLAYPGGAEADGNSSATAVVVVSEKDPAAALAAGVLARAHLGAVLLAPAGGLPGPAAAEVRRLRPTKAYVVGSTTALSAAVVTGLKQAGVPAAGITRIPGSGAGLAAAVAGSMDARSSSDKSAHTPAFASALVVNPASPTAAAVAAYAAALHKLPKPARYASTAADAAGASRAFTSAAVRAGVPSNVVYVVDSAQAMQAALSGSAVARRGGLLLLVPHADVAATQRTLSGLGLGTRVDRILVLARPAG
ncbi:MAG: glycoside hydrolase [Actinobacteria bacterium]|nr:glycoside hydrolase [Actinomycetota bacterium]